MIDPATQLDRFTEGIRLLGGQHAAARAFGVSERTIRRIVAGDVPLHEGFLRDMAKALLHHADCCRAIERALSPAFLGNLTADQRAKPAHPRAYHLREKD